MQELIESLRAAGVRLALSTRGVEFDGPKDALSPGVIEQLRRNRSELIELLRSEAAGGDEEGEPGKCPWCGPVRLLEGMSGLWCLRCERLAWVFTECSIIRADYVGEDFDGTPWVDDPVKAPGEKEPHTRNKREASNTAGELF